MGEMISVMVNVVNRPERENVMTGQDDSQGVAIIALEKRLGAIEQRLESMDKLNRYALANMGLIILILLRNILGF